MSTPDPGDAMSVLTLPDPEHAATLTQLQQVAGLVAGLLGRHLAGGSDDPEAVKDQLDNVNAGLSLAAMVANGDFSGLEVRVYGPRRLLGAIAATGTMTVTTDGEGYSDIAAPAVEADLAIHQLPAWH